MNISVRVFTEDIKGKTNSLCLESNLLKEIRNSLTETISSEIIFVENTVKIIKVYYNTS